MGTTCELAPRTRKLRRKCDPWWREEFAIKTKEEVEKKIQAVVASVPNNYPIAPEKAEFVLNVLKHHYKWGMKVGVGLKHLEVRDNLNTRGFWIVRTDGSEIDISWVVALQPGGRPSQKEEVDWAARDRIKDQIAEHHAKGPCANCPICKKLMIRGQGLHVDHVYEFWRLLADFLTTQGLTHDDIEHEDAGIGCRWVDDRLATEWADYHKRNAKLRLVHEKCNLGRLRR